MLLYALILSVIWTTNINHGLCEYMGTTSSLRSNLSDLMEGTLVFSDENLPYDPMELFDSTPRDKSEYDFIVVGAGSAGAAVAARLSEIYDFKVLLIEAGGKEYSILDIPPMVGALQLNDEIVWRYQTEPTDKFCLGFTDHKCNWPRGKVTGGSSVLNFMVATRCNEKDYDEWANVTGDDSWSYKNMLKYLIKLESYNIQSLETDHEFHNKKGPVNIINYQLRNQFGDAFIEGGKELGYPELFGSEQRPGFSYFQLTMDKGERWSTNRAYLRPAKYRKNLIFTRKSLVQKILINGRTKKAYGVRFSKFGRIIEVKARKEVILCAGTVNSAQLLMLSGIGPQQHLKNLNIKVIKDAPVGENLMDHISYGGLIFKVNDSSTFKNSNLLDPENPQIEEYVKFRAGPLGLGPGFQALGYVNVDQPGSTDARPNMELIFGPITGMKDPIFSKIFNIDEKYRKQMNADTFDHSAWTIWPMIMLPKSRGKILLRSNNPTDKPKIYPNYLSNPEDVQVLIKGIRMVLKLSETDALKKFGSELYQVPLPNCQDLEKNSDAYWECALRTYTLNIYHYSGTCKMGKVSDKTAVVDPQSNVIGVKGLRVIDGSIMPSIPSAHVNVPIIAIAEKISDVIKKQYGYTTDDEC